MAKKSFPEDDRRRHPRAQVELPVEFYRHPEGQKLADGRSVNISPGGLLAECGSLDGLAEGQQVALRLGMCGELCGPTGESLSGQVRRLQHEERPLCAVELLGQAPEFLLAPELVGRHPSILQVKKQLLQLADSDLNVLIQGETGTGKNVVAQLLHRYSFRSERPFIRVNCPAIAPSLIESELFGHVKGAFTDARTSRPGLFRLADGGTLVLDEISAIPTGLQAKLLQAIEEKKFIPVGGSRAVEVQTRIVAITNQGLRTMMRSGQFRPDLYHRINEAPLFLPPLRERAGDIPLLVEHFLCRFARQFDKEYRPVDPATMELLQSYPWPGNVRELSNCLKYGVLTGSFSPPEEGDFGPEPPAGGTELNPPEEAEAATLKQARDRAVERAERTAVLQALKAERFNKTRAARVLGISRRTLLRKINRYDIQT